MALPAPTAAPPSFYDNLPAGGDAAAGGPPPAGAPGAPGAGGAESDVDGELMKGLTGVYRVLSKMADLKKDLKPDFDKIKTDIKSMVVKGLKQDPKALEGGSDNPPPDAAATPPPDASAGGPPPPPPSQTDESHAA